MDGTLPEQAEHILKGPGKGLETNGEAIFGTTNWTIFGERPHQVQKGSPNSEKNLPVLLARIYALQLKVTLSM